MSWANAALRASSIIALPPYFTTTRAPRKRFEPGQRLDERARLGLGDTQGGGVDGAAQSLVGGWHVGVLRCDLVAQVE